MKEICCFGFKCSHHVPSCFKITINFELSPDLQYIASRFDTYTSVPLSMYNLFVFCLASFILNIFPEGASILICPFSISLQAGSRFAPLHQTPPTGLLRSWTCSSPLAHVTQRWACLQVNLALKRFFRLWHLDLTLSDLISGWQRGVDTTLNGTCLSNNKASFLNAHSRLTCDLAPMAIALQSK